VADFVSMNKNVDTLLDIIMENNGQFPEFFMGRRVEYENYSVRGENGPELYYEREKEYMTLPPNIPEGERDGTEQYNKKEWDFSNETPYETRFFSVKYVPDENGQYLAYTGRIASVSKTDAILYARAVLDKYQKLSKSRGYYENYRYGIKMDEDGGILVVFVDATKEKNNAVNVLRFSLIMSAIGLLGVFLLVNIFSKKVFKPVEESYKKQKRFITDASHELKTPISIISANIEVLEMENEESKWTASVKNQVNRMSGLVEQMVTLSRMDESDKLTMSRFDLSEAVKDTAEGYFAVAQQNNQKFTTEIEDEIALNGDEAKIRQMVGLLLDNAVKYACVPEGEDLEKAEIRLSLKKKGRKAYLKLYNTTDQVEAGNQDILFERFYRPDASRNSKKGGSGIGLSIVKSIVEAHKGKITAFSKDGKSIQFSAELPIHS